MSSETHFRTIWQKLARDEVSRPLFPQLRALEDRLASLSVDAAVALLGKLEGLSENYASDLNEHCVRKYLSYTASPALQRQHALVEAKDALTNRTVPVEPLRRLIHFVAAAAACARIQEPPVLTMDFAATENPPKPSRSRRSPRL